jgi:hypothetical protein
LTVIANDVIGRRFVRLESRVLELERILETMRDMLIQNNHSLASIMKAVEGEKT